MLALLSPLGRRVGSLLLSHPNLPIRRYAAYSLALWNDQEARNVLLDFTKKNLRSSTPIEQKLQAESIKLLISWGAYGDWNGILLPSDISRLQPLLSKQIPAHTRLLAATFIGQVVLMSYRYQKYDTKQLREILSKGSQLTQIPIPLAVMAAKNAGTVGCTKRRDPIAASFRS